MKNVPTVKSWVQGSEVQVEQQQLRFWAHTRARAIKTRVHACARRGSRREKERIEPGGGTGRGGIPGIPGAKGPPRRIGLCTRSANLTSSSSGRSPPTIRPSSGPYARNAVSIGTHAHTHVLLYFCNSPPRVCADFYAYFGRSQKRVFTRAGQKHHLLWAVLLRGAESRGCSVGLLVIFLTVLCCECRWCSARVRMYSGLLMIYMRLWSCCAA